MVTVPGEYQKILDLVLGFLNTLVFCYQHHGTENDCKE